MFHIFRIFDAFFAKIYFYVYEYIEEKKAIICEKSFACLNTRQFTFYVIFCLNAELIQALEVDESQEPQADNDDTDIDEGLSDEEHLAD